MMRHRTLWSLIAALLLTAAAGAAPPDTAPPAGAKAGNITALLPVAHVVRGPAKQEVSTVVKKGDDVVWNDVVRTDKGGRARITLLDQSILSVGSQAELRILKHDPKSQQTAIEVGYGRVRMEVTPITKQGGSFEVKTPTAVAGVIGTVFGVDSSIGSTTFLCISDTLMVGSSDASIPGRVPCTPGMAAVVAAGKPAVTRPMTQQELQKIIQDTEPAMISAMNPSSLLPGATADASITGTQLGNVNAVSSSSSSVTATLNAGGTATSVSVHLVIAAKATPGPVTLTLSKPSGVSSAAVFSILAPPNTAGAAGGDYKQPFLTTIEQERQSAIAGLNGLGVGLQQSADQGYNQISTANSALNPPLDISQAANDLKNPVNAGLNAAATDGANVNQAAQTAVTNFTTQYETAWQALLARVSSGAPDNQFQNDLTSAFNQVNATLLAAFGGAQTDLGQQVQTQNASIQQITNTWLAKLQQVAQSQAPPTIKGLSTSAAPITGGVQVTITGANFDPSTKVMFGSVTASNVTYVSPSQLTVIVPPGNAGSVDLTVVSGTGLSSTLSGGFSFGGPVAAINPPDIAVNPSAPLTLDGSHSVDTLAGASVTAYSWTLCSLNFKPPQVGVSIPGMNAPICNPAGPGFSGTDTLFAPTAAPIAPGQYFARLQVTDNLGASAVIFSAVTVSQPTYDDVPTRMNSLAQAFSTLQSSSVLAFFDSSYVGLTSLQQSLQTVFATYSSMTVNLLSVTPNMSANTAQVQANWQLKYTLKGNTTIISPTPETQTTVWTLTPGKGWYITEFRLPNGFTQGTLPAVPVTNTAQPNISLTSSAGNTDNSTPLQLNGPLPSSGVTLFPTRSDSVTTGSVTLVFSGSQVTSTPQQLTFSSYGGPGQPVDFAATIDGSGAITRGSANVTVTPVQPQPAAAPTPTLLYFNVGDISLSGIPSCVPLVSGQATVSGLVINALNGFNIPAISWQWLSFPQGISASPVNGTATLSATTYSLPAFTLTTSSTGAQSFQLAVTIQQGSNLATDVFPVTINLSSACGAAHMPMGVGGGQGVSGSWTRGGFRGGMARAVQPVVRTAALPDLQINATSVSFTPSIPNPGDTVAVRFRVTNAGNADAQHVPIALVVNGVTVASDTLDVRAGASTLAALEWTNARATAGSRSPVVTVAVDPNHTVQQKTTLGKSVPLARFAFLSAWAAQTATFSTTTQRVTLEVPDGSCVGFRFAAGAGSSCGSADVEITVEELAAGRYLLATQTGIADLGPVLGSTNVTGAQYQQEAQAVVGHTYAVQLRGGKTGILRLLAIRNPAQTSVKGRQVFGGSNPARSVGTTTGPVETGDASGVRTASQSKVYFDVSYQMQ